MKPGDWRETMSQVSTVLERTDRIAHGGATAHFTRAAADRVYGDDDDLLDEWLASLSVDDFDRFLSGLAELR
jgi:hypothetical protein